MTTCPTEGGGWDVPEGFVDPVANPDLPFVVAHQGEDEPVPPADRIAEAEREDVETRAAEVGYFAGRYGL